MMTSLLNKSAVRAFILAKLERLRPHLGIQRVSAAALEQLEARLRAQIIRAIEQHPTMGKTFRLD